MALAAKLALGHLAAVPRPRDSARRGGIGKRWWHRQGSRKTAGTWDVTSIPFPPCSESCPGNEMKRTQGHQRNQNNATHHLPEMLKAIRKDKSYLLGG